MFLAPVMAVGRSEKKEKTTNPYVIDATPRSITDALATTPVPRNSSNRLKVQLADVLGA